MKWAGGQQKGGSAEVFFAAVTLSLLIQNDSTGGKEASFLFDQSFSLYFVQCPWDVKTWSWSGRKHE